MEEEIGREGNNKWKKKNRIKNDKQTVFENAN